MKKITSVYLEKDVVDRGKILAILNQHKNFSDFVNSLIKREVEVEQARIESAKRKVS